MNRLTQMLNSGSAYKNNISTGWSLLTCVAMCSVVGSVNAAPGDDEISTSLVFQSGFFRDAPIAGDDRPQISSLSLESELFIDFSHRISFIITPYVKYEHLSEDELHEDLRKFEVRYAGDSWDLRAGIGQEFWGVTESRNVVDTINQSDFAADFTGETKLGQPIIQLTKYSDLGDFSAYVLPVFREPEYASADSRPRLPFVANEELYSYESSEEKQNIDFALRWSKNISVWDIGVHYFNGTRRTPTFLATETGVASRFSQSQQIGLDAQATVGALLSKFEWVQIAGNELENHAELVAGFEYTLSQLFDSQIHAGLLLEGLYDSRQETADHSFQNDVMLGIRLAFNDTNSTELLVSTISDLDNGSSVSRLEFDRRIASNFTVGLQAQLWNNVDEDAVLNSFSTEDNAQFRIKWFF